MCYIHCLHSKKLTFLENKLTGETSVVLDDQNVVNVFLPISPRICNIRNEKLIA